MTLHITAEMLWLAILAGGVLVSAILRLLSYLDYLDRKPRGPFNKPKGGS